MVEPSKIIFLSFIYIYICITIPSYIGYHSITPIILLQYKLCFAYMTCNSVEYAYMSHPVWLWDSVRQFCDENEEDTHCRGAHDALGSCFQNLTLNPKPVS